MWPVWGNLLHGVRTGRSACEHLHDTPFYPFLIENPDVGTPFNRYMSKTSAQHNAAILDAYDFAGIATLAAIGGGHGGTETEFRALFAEAGLAITAVHSTRSPNVIIEGLRDRHVHGW